MVGALDSERGLYSGSWKLRQPTVYLFQDCRALSEDGPL